MHFRVEGAISKKSSTHMDIQIGLNIRTFRLKSCLTTTELGQRIGVSRSQIESYESGATRVPAGRLSHIADVLKVPLEMIFDGCSNVTIVEPYQVENRPLPKPDGLRLLEAFNNISNIRMRRAILHFFEKIAAL